MTQCFYQVFTVYCLCNVSDFGTEQRPNSHVSVEGRSNALVVERITRISIICAAEGDGNKLASLLSSNIPASLNRFSTHKVNPEKFGH